METQTIKRFDKGDFLNGIELKEDMYQILDSEGFDVVGEYVSFKDAKNIIEDFKND